MTLALSLQAKDPSLTHPLWRGLTWARGRLRSEGDGRDDGYPNHPRIAINANGMAKASSRVTGRLLKLT